MGDADALRAELHAWLDDHLTDAVIAAGRHGPQAHTIDVLRAWNRVLADAGWAAPAWPVEHGGRGAGIAEQVVYLEVMSERSVPGPVNVIGVSNIAPAIMTVGTEEQQARFLRPMLRGDEIWSQGMSEPDAGSDLASLRTSAVLDGDDFVVTGQKTWNSLGHLADWCQLYVRTNPDVPKHRGISCLLVDLRTAGIEIRPITTISGDQAFAEVFLDEARIPVSSLLGPLDGGWGVAMTTLSFERAGVARLHLGLTRKFESLVGHPVAAAELAASPPARDRLMRVHERIETMRWMTDRSLARMQTGVAPDPAAGSLAKLAWGAADQALCELAGDLLGAAGMLEDEWAYLLASSRQTTIAGGTTEINRSIVAEHGLGLPR